MRLFIGLDVSLAKTAKCVDSEHEKIVREAEVASEAECIPDRPAPTEDRGNCAVSFDVLHPLGMLRNC